MAEETASPSADIVAQAFALQYYTILQYSPGLLYQFYQDTSKLGRTEVDGGMGLTTTMEAINEKIMSYGSLKVDVKSVDAQSSYKNGVIVTINGDLINKDESRRMFVQTFFLAPQQTGYFVLNDLFRFIGESYSGKSGLANGEVPQSCPDQAPTSVVENAISGQTVEVNGIAVHCASVNGEAIMEKGEPTLDTSDAGSSEPQVVIKSVPEAEEVSKKNQEERQKKKLDEVPKKKLEEVPNKSFKGIPKSDEELPNKSFKGIPKSDEELPKKSYASIVLDSSVQAASPTSPESFPKMKEQQAAVAAIPVSVVDTPVSGSNIIEDGNHDEAAGDGHSIYLKNLPLSATHQMVDKAFSKFGPVKFDSIQIRRMKGFCFGFVDFEVPQAVQDAIEASPITIDGHPVGVEAKKSTGSRVGNRGRFSYSGRGGYRNEGGKVRGRYGGRGYGQGDVNRNEFANRGHNRRYQNRSGDVHYTGNESRHGYRSGGLNPSTAARVQRVPASA